MTSPYLADDRIMPGARGPRLLGVVIVVLIALGVVGSFTVQTASAPVEVQAAAIGRAPELARHAGTQRISVRVHVSANGRSATVIETGAVDPVRNIATLHIEGAAAGGGRIDLVASGTTIYLAVPESRRVFTQGREWISVDARQFQSQGLGSGTDMLANLDVLSAVGQHVEKVGRENVHGVPTVHYRAALDLGRVADRLPPALQAQAAQLRAVGAPGVPIQVDVWLDDTGLPRRIEEHLKVQGSAVTVTVEISDFGKPVVVSVPAPDDVVPAASLQTALALIGLATA